MSIVRTKGSNKQQATEFAYASVLMHASIVKTRLNATPCQYHQLPMLLANIKNSIILFVCPSKILHFYKHSFYFLLGLTMVPRETGNNAYAKFWRDKQRVSTTKINDLWNGQEFTCLCRPLSLVNTRSSNS